MATVVVGTQWGDEGKGKIVDLLAQKMDYVVRYQGGHNAGHTVVVGDESFALCLVPSGILYPHVTPVIGNGMVVNPLVLLEEINMLKSRNVRCNLLKVSGNAHLIFPYHQEIDIATESRLGDRRLDTTKRGIGPAYADKAARVGLRMQDLLDTDIFREKVRLILEYKNPLLSKIYKRPKSKLSEIITLYFDKCRPGLESYICDAVSLVHTALESGKKVLFEGAQATFLDLDHGTYPFVTSSNCTAGGACTGSGVGPRHIQRVIGVAKAYLTRVGAGPFPSELADATGEHLAERGHEYGTNTKRRRRTGWFDLLMAKQAVRINSLTELVITKLDVLDELATINVCVAYKVRGKIVTELPYHQSDMHDATPVYTTLPGWQHSIQGIQQKEKLPLRCIEYLDFLQKELGLPILLVGTGPKREDIIRYGE